MTRKNKQCDKAYAEVGKTYLAPAEQAEKFGSFSRKHSVASSFFDYRADAFGIWAVDVQLFEQEKI